MPTKKYTIDISIEERNLLRKIIKTGTSTARTILRANILLYQMFMQTKVLPQLKLQRYFKLPQPQFKM